MALDTQPNLVTAIADWLNRSDLTNQIPDFITLAEAEMKRKLRRYSTRAAFTISARNMAVPADLAEIRSIYLQSGSPSQDIPIRVCTPEMLAERAARSAGVAGRPTDVAVMNGEFIFAPTPDQTYTAEIFYNTKVVALTAGNPTSTLLTDAPDMYLFGALLQAAPYLENDERIPVWQAKFDSSIDEMNLQRENEEYNFSLQAVRLPVVFG